MHINRTWMQRYYMDCTNGEMQCLHKQVDDVMGGFETSRPWGICALWRKVKQECMYWRKVLEIVSWEFPLVRRIVV